MSHNAYDRGRKEYEEMVRHKQAEGRLFKISFEERISSSAMTCVTRLVRESELPGIMKLHPEAVAVSAE